MLPVVTGGHVLEGGGIGIEGLGGRQVRHRIEAPGALRVLVDGAPRTKDYGLYHKSQAVSLVEQGVETRYVSGVQAVSHPTVDVVASLSVDDSMEQDVAGDAADIHGPTVLEVKVDVAGAESLLVPERNLFGRGLGRNFVSIAGMGVQCLGLPFHLHDRPLGEHPVVDDAFPSVDGPVYGDGKTAAVGLHRVREVLHLGHILPGGDVGEDISP